METTASIKLIEIEGKKEPQPKPIVIATMEKEKLENTASTVPIEIKGKYKLFGSLLGQIPSFKMLSLTRSVFIFYKILNFPSRP